MAVRYATETESAKVGTLVKDIVRDLEKLGQQHIRLFKRDLHEDLHRLREGSVVLMIGGGVLLIGGLLLAVTVAEFLVFLGLYSWAAYGLVAVVLTCLGAGLAGSGWSEFKRATPLADKTLETLEEDVQWMKHPT